MTSRRAWAAGLAVVVLWASAFPAIRVAAPGLGVIGLSFVRLATAAIVLLAIAPFARMRLPERRQLPLVLAAAFAGMTAYQLLLNWSELHVPAGAASIVVASAPLISAGAAAVTLGERLTAAQVGGSAVAIAGVVLVCLVRSGATVSSALWVVVGAAVVQGIYHPLTKPLLRTRSGLEVAAYGQVARSAWVAAVYLGLLPSALGFALWGYAVARLPIATSTSLLYLVPPVTVVIAFVWLGERPRLGELLGGLVVIVGVLLERQGGRRVRPRASGAAEASPTATLAGTHLREQAGR